VSNAPASVILRLDGTDYVTPGGHVDQHVPSVWLLSRTGSGLDGPREKDVRTRTQVEVRPGEIRIHYWTERRTELHDEDGDPLWRREYEGYLPTRVNTAELLSALEHVARGGDM